MALSVNDLDQILGYDPTTHSVVGFPTIAGVNQAAKPVTAMPRIASSAAAPDIPAAVSALNLASNMALPARPSPFQPINKPNASALNTAALANQYGKPATRMPLIGGASPSAPDVPMTPMGNAPDVTSGMPQVAKPKEGFGTRLLHGLERAGDIAGTAFVPGVMANIPGTMLNKEFQQNREARLAGEQSENALRQAQTANLQSETAERNAPWKPIGNPVQDDSGKWFEPIQTTDAQGNRAVAWQPLEGGPGMKAGATPEEQAFASEVASGKSPQQAWADISQAKVGAQPGNEPLGNVDAMNKTLQDRYQVLNPGKPLPPEYTLPPNATRGDYDRIDKALSGAEGAQGAKSSRDLAETDREIARQDRENQQETTRVQKASDDLNKNYVKPADDIERSYRMFQDAYNAIQRGDAKTGAEDMLLLSQHLGTTFGQVKGSRMNRDLIQEHKDAIGLQDRIERFGNMLASGQQLSPDQRKEFGDLISNMRNLTWQAVAHEAARAKVPIDMLPSDTRIKMSDSKGNVREVPGNQVQDYLDKGATVAY